MNNQLRFSVPCNWKYDLLDEINKNPDLMKVVKDFYGTKDRSFTGTGRPFFIMAKKELSEREEYINRVHDMGFEFTWLWNGPCLGFRKYESVEQTKALKELDWLEDLGVKYLTVSDPYLARFAKHYHPKIILKTSLMAEVNSLSRGYEWQDIIGKNGVITLSVMANRNYPLLKLLREKLKCDLEILLNDACVNECPLRFFHYSETAHASQTHDTILKGFYTDWCVLMCQNVKGKNPEQVLMAKWIQPSDIDKFLNIGINYFKISGRRFISPWILKALNAYSHKSYDGNLGDFLNGYNFQTNPLDLAGSQFAEYTTAQAECGTYPEDEDLMIGIPDYNAKLLCDKMKDFMTNLPFQGSRCAENCGAVCTYCYQFVDKVFFLPSKEKVESYRNYVAYLLDYANANEMFVPKEERKLINPVKGNKEKGYYGISWDLDSQKFLDDVIQMIPITMQKSAEKAIRHISERTAERKDEKSVKKELVIGILLQLVPETFKHDLLDYLKNNKIDVHQYLSNEDIKSIEKLPYSKDILNPTPDKAEQTPESKKLDVAVNNKSDWESYMANLMKAYNELPELKPILPPLAPLLLQYVITDRLEMNYWLFIDNSQINWGMGEYNGPSAPKMVHKTNFETIIKVNSGQADPIKETIAGRYTVEGDMTKLMSCTPLLPLFAKAHVNMMKK